MLWGEVGVSVCRLSFVGLQGAFVYRCSFCLFRLFPQGPPFAHRRRVDRCQFHPACNGGEFVSLLWVSVQRLRGNPWECGPLQVFPMELPVTLFVLLRRDARVRPAGTSVRCFVQAARRLRPPVATVQLHFHRVPRCPIHERLGGRDVARTVRQERCLFTVELQVFLPRPCRPLPIFPRRIGTQRQSERFVPSSRLLRVEDVQHVYPRHGSFRPPRQSRLCAVREIRVDPVRIMESAFHRIRPRFFVEAMDVASVFRPVHGVGLVNVSLRYMPVTYFQRYVITVTYRHVSEIQ